MSLSYKLYPNIIPVKGFNRSILMDLYKSDFKYIPNYFCDFLLENQYNSFTKSTFISYCGANDKFDELNNIFNFFIDNDYLVLLDIHLSYGLQNNQHIISNESIIIDTIIELSSKSNWNIENLFTILNDLGALFLEVRFLDDISFIKFNSKIQHMLINHSVEFVHYIIPFSEKTKKELANLPNDFVRLGKITFYNCLAKPDFNNDTINIEYSTQNSIDNKNCGCIHPDFFKFNVNSYYRDIKKNNCLSNKLSIDQNGEISNCPSKKSFGNLSKVNIDQLVKTKIFQKEWEVTKDKVLICSDCEYRWMCSDCRAFTSDDSTIYSKPLKCEYNPYINKWKNEEGYLSEKEVGVCIENGKLNIDYNKLTEINDLLW